MIGKKEVLGSRKKGGRKTGYLWSASTLQKKRENPPRQTEKIQCNRSEKKKSAIPVPKKGEKGGSNSFGQRPPARIASKGKDLVRRRDEETLRPDHREEKPGWPSKDGWHRQAFDGQQKKRSSNMLERGREKTRRCVTSRRGKKTHSRRRPITASSTKRESDFAVQGYRERKRRSDRVGTIPGQRFHKRRKRNCHRPPHTPEEKKERLNEQQGKRPEGKSPYGHKKARPQSSESQPIKRAVNSTLNSLCNREWSPSAKRREPKSLEEKVARAVPTKQRLPRQSITVFAKGRKSVVLGLQQEKKRGVGEK